MLTFLYLANDSDGTEIIDFETYKDVVDAFQKLFLTCQNAAKISSDNFETIRTQCVGRAPISLCGKLKCATDVDKLFSILFENNEYCNWMNVTFLKVVANGCADKKLQSLIDNYTKVIHSKLLHEVFNGNPHYLCVEEEYLKELEETFGDRYPDKVTVEELIKKKLLSKKIAMGITIIQ